jgi:SET domain
MTDLAVKGWDDNPYLSWEDKVAFMAYKLGQMRGAETPIHEVFENGFYIRVMTVPKDVLFIGRKHLVGHEVTLVKGSCIYCAPDGLKYLIKAPFTMQSPPGFYAVFLSLEDMIAYTKHPNPEESRDGKALEAKAFEPPEVVLRRGRVVSARLDYQALLMEFKLRDKDIQRITGRTDDIVDWYSDDWYLFPSAVAGSGVFAAHDFAAGDLIGPARLSGKRTPLGRFVNHSNEPNAEIVIRGDDLYLKALTSCLRHEELFTDYRKILEFNPELGKVLCQAP